MNIFVRQLNFGSEPPAMIDTALRPVSVELITSSHKMDLELVNLLRKTFWNGSCNVIGMNMPPIGDAMTPGDYILVADCGESRLRIPVLFAVDVFQCSPLAAVALDLWGSYSHPYIAFGQSLPLDYSAHFLRQDLSMADGWPTVPLEAVPADAFEKYSGPDRFVERLIANYGIQKARQDWAPRKDSAKRRIGTRTPSHVPEAQVDETCARKAIEDLQTIVGHLGLGNARERFDAGRQSMEVGETEIAATAEPAGPDDVAAELLTPAGQWIDLADGQSTDSATTISPTRLGEALLTVAAWWAEKNGHLFWDRIKQGIDFTDAPDGVFKEALVLGVGLGADNPFRSEVVDQVGRLSTTDSMSGPSPAQDESEDKIGNLLLGWSTRDMQILVSRRLTVGDNLTLNELGERIGVTRERVRQLEKRISNEFNQLLQTPNARSLWSEARQLRAEWGVAVPVDHVELRIESVVIQHPDKFTIDQILDLIRMYLAGPYKLTQDGWLQTEGGTVQTETILRALTAVRFPTVNEVDQALVEVGVRPEFAEAWRSRFRKFRTLEGHLLPWDGGAGEKAVRVLELVGTPLTRDELVAYVGDGYSPGTITNALTNSPRVMRTGRDHLGLRDWELEEYSGIEEEIVQEIERLGGEATAQYLVSRLTEQFGVSESSVRTYIQNSGRLRVGQDGKVRVLTKPKAVTGGTPPELSRNCFRRGSRIGCSIKVTKDILRGVSAPVPTAIGREFGVVRPGDKHAFGGDAGLFHLMRNVTNTTLSSIRIVAGNFGARPDDLIFACFCHPEAIMFEYLPASKVARASGIEKAHLCMGLGAFSADKGIRSIALAIGLGEDATEDDVRIRLRERSEPEFVSMFEDYRQGKPERSPTCHSSEVPSSSGNQDLLDLLDELAGPGR